MPPGNKSHTILMAVPCSKYEICTGRRDTVAEQHLVDQTVNVVIGKPVACQREVVAEVVRDHLLRRAHHIVQGIAGLLPPRRAAGLFARGAEPIC